MRNLALLLVCFCLLASPALAKELTGRVSWIYDGDTLEIDNIGKVRLLGVDCPEASDSDRDRYYLSNFSIPRQTLREVARAAKRFSIEQAKGKQVLLRFDREEKDRYGRALVYLFLPDGRMLNKLLIEQGLASVFRRYPFRERQAFIEAEQHARHQQRGLWQ